MNLIDICRSIFFSIKLYVCNLMLPSGIVTNAAVCHMLHF